MYAIKTIAVRAINTGARARFMDSATGHGFQPTELVRQFDGRFDAHFSKMLARWNSTVRWVMPRWSAMFLL